MLLLQLGSDRRSEESVSLAQTTTIAASPLLRESEANWHRRRRRFVRRAVPDNCWGRKSLYFRTPASKTTLDSIGKGAERYKVRQSMDSVNYGNFPREAV